MPSLPLPLLSEYEIILGRIIAEHMQEDFSSMRNLAPSKSSITLFSAFEEVSVTAKAKE